MATDPGEWYEEKRQEAERLAAELAGARKVRAAMQATKGHRGGSFWAAANRVIEELTEQLERARDVGD